MLPHPKTKRNSAFLSEMTPRQCFCKTSVECVHMLSQCALRSRNSIPSHPDHQEIHLFLGSSWLGKDRAYMTL